MKRSFLYLFFAASLISCNRPVKGPNGVLYKKPAQYNDYIVSRQTTLILRMLEFNKLSQKDLDAAARVLNRNAADIEYMITEIKGMPVYKGDSSLRNEAVNLFSFYKKLYTITYPEIISIRKKGVSTGEDKATLSRLSREIKTEEEKLEKAFHHAQEGFAKKNNMELGENEIQKKLNRNE